jgi:iron complex outermembrane recepter protein
VLQYDFNSNATVTLELNYDEAQTRNGDPSIPSVNGAFVLPRNFSVSDPNITDPIQLRHTFGYGQFQYRLNDDWKATAQIGVSEGFWQGFDVALRDSVRANNTVTRQARYNDQRTSNVSGQAFVNGLVKTGDVAHNLLVGIDAGYQQFRLINFTRNNVFPFTNVFSPNYAATQVTLDTLVRVNNQNFSTPSIAAWEAVYVQNTVKLIPQVILTLALRYNSIRSGTTTLKRDEALSPRFGVTLLPFENASVYGLFDQSLIPQAGRTFAGDEFRPLRGTNFEVGAKYDLLDGKLSASAAYFTIRKTNALTTDPNNVGFQIQTGEIASSGIEIDVIGSPVDGLNVIANYAYTDVKVVQDTRVELVGRREQAPIHAANLWATYRISQGVLKGATIRSHPRTDQCNTARRLARFSKGGCSTLLHN